MRRPEDENQIGVLGKQCADHLHSLADAIALRKIPIHGLAIAGTHDSL